MYRYDDTFYEYINAGAVSSARQVIPVIRELLPEPIDSVLDVGCGAGAWLSIWLASGSAVQGLDGPYIERDSLLIPEAMFRAQDLEQSFELSQKFDLVQCLEVAEHLPGTCSEQLVASLCRHADQIFFSAAAPGQGGENHINEQPYRYWRDLFAMQGYQLYDPIRSAISGMNEVKPWYRYNSFLFVRSDTLPRIHEHLRPYRIENNDIPPDVSPFLYRLRKRIIGMLPSTMSTMIAVVKKNVFRTLGRS